MIGNPANISPPPKFGGDNAPGPSTQGDWAVLYRWLTQLWQFASQSETLSTVSDTGLVCTNAFVDIPATLGPSGKCGVLLDLIGTYAIVGNLNIAVDNGADNVQVRLVVNGVVQAEIIECGVSGGIVGTAEFSPARLWFVENTVGKPATLAKLHARKVINAGNGNILPGNTSIKAFFLG